MLKMKFLIILCEVLILGISHLADAQLSDKFYIRHLAPPEGPGYDLFYYDGVSLRDEKWRFDYANRDTAVHRRFGLKNEKSSQFHVVDTLSDANGFRQRTRILSDPASIESLLAMGVEPPTTLHNAQKYGIMPRIKLRDNSDQEGQPRDSTLGFLNGVTLGVTLNRPATPGDSYIQGFVQSGNVAPNNQPGLQYGIPNLGILSGGRPPNDTPSLNRPPFSFPFFGNNGALTPPAQSPPPPPPPQNQPSFFGIPFGNREPPPILPLVQPSPPQQPNFLAGLQNLQIPFIGKPQTTTITTTEPSIPATNPSIFANFPNFGFQNNNKPTTTTSTTTTTPVPQGLFSNLHLPSINIGQTTTTSTPETTTTTNRPFGFNLPDFSGIFPNNGKDANKKIDNRFGPPGHGHGHRQPPNHPPNHPPKHSASHPHRPSQSFQTGAGEILLSPDANKPLASTTEKVASSSYAFNEFFPSLEGVTEKISEEFTPSPITTTTTTTTTVNLVTELPNQTGLLQSNAVEPSTDPDIPPPIQFVESLVAVVEQNSYALGIQEKSNHSFSNVEPAKPPSTQPIVSSRSDDVELITSANIPVDPLPNVPQPLTELLPSLPKDLEQTTVATIENGEILDDGDQTTNQIISDINSLSDNPAFPTLPSSVAEPAFSAGIPFPILDLVPPFETEPGDLGIHEDIVLSKINGSESKDTAIPTVPSILELIRRSQANTTNEKLLQPEAPMIESLLLDQDLSEPVIELKPAEIIGINSLEQNDKVKIPEIDLLPPFESGNEDTPTTEKTLTISIAMTTTVSSVKDVVLSNVISPETNLLPPFEGFPVANDEEGDQVRDVIENKSSEITTALPKTTTTTTTTPQTTTSWQSSTTRTSTEILASTTEISAVLSIDQNNVTVPEINLLPPFEGGPVSDIVVVNTITSTTHKPKITITTTAEPQVTTNTTLGRDEKLPEIDLLPPFETTVYKIPPTASPPMSGTQITATAASPFVPQFERKPLPDGIENRSPIITTASPKTTTTTTTPRTTTNRQRSTTSTSTYTLASTTEIPNIVSVNLNNFTIPDINLLPPFEGAPVSDKVVVNTITSTINKPKIPKATTVPEPQVTTSFTLGRDEKLPEIDLLPPFESTVYKIPPIATPSLNGTQMTTTATSPVVPQFERSPLPVGIENRSPVITTVSPTTTSTTTKPQTTTNRQRSTTRTTTSTLASTTEISPVIENLNNFTIPDINLLPPFESVTVSDIVVKTTKSTTINKPKTTITTTTSTTPNRVGKVPEIELLPPFETRNHKILPTTTLAINSIQITTTPRITITKMLPVATTTTAPPHIIIRLPESDLLPPFEGNPVSHLIEKPLPVSSINKPKTTITTTTTPRTTTTSQRSTPSTSTTTLATTTKKLTVVASVDLNNFPASEINLLPISDSASSTTTNRPKTTTISLPDIDLLPPFETTIFKLPPTLRITTTPRTTPANIPSIVIRIPDSDLLPPIESNRVTAQQFLSTTSVEPTTLVITTVASLRTTTSPTNIAQIIPKELVTTTPQKITDTKVTPIYQRQSTMPVNHPEVNLLPLDPSKTSTITTPTQSPSTVVTGVTENQLSENVVLPDTEVLPQFAGSGFDRAQNKTNILPPRAGVSKIISTTNTNSTRTVTTTSTTKTIPRTTPPPPPTTTEKLKAITPVAPIPTPSKYFSPPFKTPTYILELNTSSLNLTDRFNNSAANTSVSSIPTPSKYFLPPFKTPMYILQLNTNSINQTERFDHSATNKIAKQLDQSTIRTETDKIVNSVRRIIEHTSQSVLPTAHTDFTGTTLSEGTRSERSSTTRAQPKHGRRTPSRHEAKHNRHKFHSYNVRYPVTELIPPPIRNPGQLDVYDLDTYFTQDGQNLYGSSFQPNFNEMHALPVIPSTRISTESELQTTTEGFPIFSTANSELTTKAATMIKRPVFVNVDDEDNMETTTSLLDTRLSPNAIKSLIG